MCPKTSRKYFVYYTVITIAIDTFLYTENLTLLGGRASPILGGNRTWGLELDAKHDI
jgi:hypothetical protein